MSHANGRVRFSDGTVMHCEYNGTSDIMKPVLFDTYDEMVEYWRNEQPKQDPKPNDVELAEAATDYGNGFSWSVLASKQSRVIVAGQDPYHLPFAQEIEIHPYLAHESYQTPEDGLPSWWL